jgi:hypothetical protein
MARPEGAGCSRIAGKAMPILSDCNPKAGSQCGKASPIENKMKWF